MSKILPALKCWSPDVAVINSEHLTVKANLKESQSKNDMIKHVALTKTFFSIR